ncbi:transcriptional regulator, PadR family [Methanococcus maripaludis C5]|uniref:Transcriptional regulator, PadR family n=1 Tax=Methanococcus maripaludis (strain C5 / ATCC BAA-1333) TaxID=402880 RepID=A4FYA0_METM5|nr:PadR family transcriptional regulator [Methanococcus maripaludis]ABO35184.1 transcriptional regulator, PadR family [Methanococcus maripaludis C5]
MDGNIEISNVESAILGLLLEKPMYGYEIEKIIEERKMRQWTEIAFSSIYYVLKKLEEKELVECETENKHGRARKIYFATDSGQKAMRAKVKDLISNYEKIISGFDLGMSNLEILSKEEALECFENYLSSVEEMINHISGINKSLENDCPKHILALSNRCLAHLNAEKEFIMEFKDKFKD